MILCLQLILVILVMYFTGLVIRRWDCNVKPIILVVTAIFAFLLTQLTDFICRKNSDPLPKVTVSQNEKGLDLVVSMRQPARGLTVRVPVRGKVIGIKKFGPILVPILHERVGFRSEKLRSILGDNSKFSTRNEVQLALQEIPADTPLSYRIITEPHQDFKVFGVDHNKFVFAGEHHCEVTYTWLYRGNVETKQFEVDLKFNAKLPARKSPVKIKGVILSEKPLSREEIKELYELGPPGMSNVPNK